MFKSRSKKKILILKKKEKKDKDKEEREEKWEKQKKVVKEKSRYFYHFLNNKIDSQTYFYRISLTLPINTHCSTLSFCDFNQIPVN